MGESRRPRVAIVDLGVGNLFSVRQACTLAGMDATLVTTATQVRNADAVIVPGVGAFGDAMRMLHRLDLAAPLRDLAAEGRPLVGICLGMQLFMSESEEFGRHRGLNLLAGSVVHFGKPRGAGRELKVPHVGWNRIFPAGQDSRATTSMDAPGEWSDGPLQGIRAGEYMYFVHSYYAKPEDQSTVDSVSRYGDVEFCASVRMRNIFACQFHPERSGERGVEIYRNIARHITDHLGSEGQIVA